MGADNRRVDHGVFVVGVFRQMLENPLPDAAFAPARVARMDHPEIPEPLRQVAPGDPGAVTVQNGFDEEPVILGRAADMPLASGKKALDPFPLIVP